MGEEEAEDGRRGVRGNSARGDRGRRREDSTAKDERQAIDQLKQLRGARSLDWLCKNL